LAERQRALFAVVLAADSPDVVRLRLPAFCEWVDVVELDIARIFDRVSVDEAPEPLRCQDAGLLGLADLPQNHPHPCGLICAFAIQRGPNRPGHVRGVCPASRGGEDPRAPARGTSADWA